MRIASVLGSLALAASSVARAADCPEPYSIDAMLEDLVAVETFLRNADNELAGKAALELETGIQCATEVVPRMITGRAIRAIGSGLVASGDETRGEQWFRTAAELEQSFDFGIEDLPEGHRVREVYANAKSSSSGEEVVVAGATLATGAAILDGRKILEPKARIDRLHLFQFDTGAGVKSWIIEDNQFPNEVLILAPPPAVGKNGKVKPPKETAKVPEPAVAVAPKPAAAAPVPKVAPAAPEPRPARASATAQNTVVVERQRPWEKTPLLIGGGTVIAGGVAVYYASFVARQKFNDSNDVDELEPLQSNVNRLFIASMAVLAVGAGTVTWGAILDGTGAPLPALHIRF